MTRPAAPALLTLLAACAALPPVDAPSPTEPTITVCINLPLEHVEAAERAVAQWDRALRGWRRVVAVSGEFGCDKVVVETTDENAELPEAVGWVDRIGGDQVYLKRGKYEDDVVRILGHELAHSLGAQHLEGPGSLMGERIGPSTPYCPDPATIMQVVAWNRVEVGLVDLEVCE